MAGTAEVESGRRRHRRSRRKRLSKKHMSLLYNLGWVAGGVAIGTPILAAAIYLASR